MLTTLISDSLQIPLIHTVDEDDIILLNSPDAEWFRVLYHLPYQEYRTFGAEYYDALYEFNKREKQKKQERTNKQKEEIVETKDEAKTRLLFDRTTMKNTKEEKSIIIFQNEKVESKPPKVNPDSISPGIVPLRLGGKKQKCFFAMLKSFIGAPMMGFASEADKVYLLLTSNPSFARACGFVPKNEKDGYHHEHVPSLRKLEQFDQIMKEWGIWDKIKLNTVKNNIESGVIKKENELVGDTTHYHAYSGFETVKYEDDKGKDKKNLNQKLLKIVVVKIEIHVNMNGYLPMKALVQLQNLIKKCIGVIRQALLDIPDKAYLWMQWQYQMVQHLMDKPFILI